MSFMSGFGQVAGNVNMLAGGLQGAIAAQEDRRKQAQLQFENAFQLANQAQQQANWNLSRGDRLTEQSADNAWRSKVFQTEQDRWNTNRGDTLTQRQQEQDWRSKVFGNQQDWKTKEFGLQTDQFSWQKQKFDEQQAMELLKLQQKGANPIKFDSPEDIQTLTGWQTASAKTPYTPEGQAATRNLRNSGQPIPFQAAPENTSMTGPQRVLRGALASFPPFAGIGWLANKINPGRVDAITRVKAGIDPENMAVELGQLTDFVRNQLPAYQSGKLSDAESSKVVAAYKRMRELKGISDRFGFGSQ